MASSQYPHTPTSATNGEESLASPLRTAYATLHDNVVYSISNQKPWTEALDWRSFSRPTGIADATARAQTNWSYYKVNYEIFGAVLIAGSLIWHGLGGVAVTLALVTGWFYILAVHNHREPLHVFGTTFGRVELIVSMSIITLLLAFIFTSIGSTLITALLFSTLLILAHATTRATAGLPPAGDPNLPILAQAATAYATSPATGQPRPGISVGHVAPGYPAIYVPVPPVGHQSGSSGPGIQV